MRRPGRLEPGRPEVLDLARWLLLAALGLSLTALAVQLHARLGTASAPFIGVYRLKLDGGTAIAPFVAAVVLLAVLRGWVRRLRWGWLLVSSYVAAAAWTLGLAAVEGGNGLARPMLGNAEYLADLPRIRADPTGFVRHFITDSGQLSVATRQHPPGPGLLLWLLDGVGVHRTAVLGLIIALIGVATVPLVLSCVRALCHEPAARALAPLLVLAPWAIWVAVSMDAVTATLAAGMVACGVRASSPRRRGTGAVGWSIAAGLLLGVAALFSYAVPWLALSVISVYFVRRRAALNVVTGLAALVPIALAQAAGFVWTRGLSAAQADFSLRVEPHRSAALWGAVSLVLLLLALGPGSVASARKVRRTPGWPFLVGAAAAVVFAVGAGLARGEMEHAWLPYFPWLLVAAVAPERAESRIGRAPLLLAGTGALSAIVLAGVLRTAW